MRSNLSRMVTARRPLSLEEFLRLPEEEPPLEYCDGEVTQKVSPMQRHSVLQAALLERLTQAAGPDRTVLVLPELRVTFAGSSRVPDIAVFVRARVEVDDSGEVVDRVAEPPDIAVEIVSPGQSATALVRRCVWYVANGVRVALLIDPEDRSVLVFRDGRSLLALRGTDMIEVSEILAAFRLTVDELFASLRLR
jgi:Uma2 family endonuclease